MTLQLDTPFGQLAVYVEGLETGVARLQENYDIQVKRANALEVIRVSHDKQIAELSKQLEDVNQSKPGWEQKVDTVIAIGNALDALGIPYVFGGEDRTGMDCSGFVQFLYGQVGVPLPRVSKNQASVGTQIDKNDMSKWRKGDLVAFDYNKEGTVDHIGIYLGNGTMLHTNTPATGINIKSVSPSSSLVSVNRVL